MPTTHDILKLEKHPTGIPGIDFIAEGGLPRGRTTLVTGTSGSAKTVFAAQFLASGIESAREPGVFITFEEVPDDIRRNVLSFGWNVPEWEDEGLWCFVDASPSLEDAAIFAGDYDLGALISRIRHAVEKVGAKRVSLDSLGAIFSQFTDQKTVRREILRLVSVLRELEVTAILTAERGQDYGPVARHGVEEFVTDNVLILRNVLEETRRRRTIEVLKFRGTTHAKGEYPFSVLPERGIVAIPLSAIELKQESSDTRRASGNEVLDEMTGGGFFRDSIILVSGATGTGKTLLTTEFMSGGVASGERSLLFAFEEGHHQLMRNAAGWGFDYRKMVRDGNLRIEAEYPEIAGLEDHLIRMKNSIDRYKPDRIAIDSMSALERVASVKGFREFIISLTSFIKDRGIMGLFTSTTPTLLGGTSTTETHISTITDAIILLRYVELYGEMQRGLTVLKMRGSRHDKRIRRFEVDDRGMHIGEPFDRVVGVLSGNISLVSQLSGNDAATGGMISESETDAL